MDTEIINGVRYIKPKAGVSISSLMKDIAIKRGYRIFNFTWEHIVSLPRKKKKLMKKLAYKYLSKSPFVL